MDHLSDGVDAEEGEKFWEACEIQRLDLSFNQITRLPPEVGLCLASVTSFPPPHIPIVEGAYRNALPMKVLQAYHEGRGGHD